MAKVLLGFMGAGKSTIARGLDPNYLDMDALIEKRLGMSIADFFAEKGEGAFSSDRVRSPRRFTTKGPSCVNWWRSGYFSEKSQLTQDQF